MPPVTIRPMSKQEPLYIIDGSAYIYRAYHAITSLSTKDGLPTNATYGFTTTLLRVIKEKNPRYLAVAFDVKGPTFRHELYSEYKANRPPMPDDLQAQIPYIKDIVAANNIACLEKQGYEADDIIATAAKHFSGKGTPVVIISGDKDLLQLVSDTVTFWDPMNNRLMNPEGVKKKYNVNPEQILELFALMGDSSDNIPGVRGVGPKTAEKLINTFDTIENLYKNLDKVDKIKLREKLAQHKDEAFLSKELVQLDYDIPIPTDLDEYQLPEPDYDKLRKLYTKLEFTKLTKNEIPAESFATKGFHLIQSETALKELIPSFNSADLLVVDTETSSLNPLNTDLVGISLCTNEKEAYYIPIGHKDESGEICADQLPEKKVLDLLKPLLIDKKLPKLGHNLKFDYEVLESHGVTLNGPLWDTMIASYLLDPSRRSHKLDTLCEEYLEKRPTSFADVTSKDKREDCFSYVNLEDAKNYSCEDVIGAFLLWETFRPQLEKLNLWELFADTEITLLPILAKMERTGITVDLDILETLSKEFSDQINNLEEKIHTLAGHDFNINSPKQLGEVLFDELKLPHGRKTKTGYSTDAKVLEKLAAYHDLPAAVIEHRNLAKLKSTYVDKLATLINPATGRIHTSFNQTVTATGRLSSSNPNLQNIPIRTAEGQRIRAAFIPQAGHVFLAADYSQIDLRVMAHYSQDKALLEAFRANEDVHNLTAAEIFRVHETLITTQMRRVAKTINFGIVYGMSAFGLSNQLNLGRKEAQTFIDRYFDHYPGVKSFMKNIIIQAQRDGYVTTLLNRRRLLPDIKSSNRTRREFAERTAINTPIQGTAADIIKLATIEVFRQLQKEKLKTELILQIHDELVFEVPEKEIEKTSSIVKKVMENVMNLDVPLVVNISMGQNLAET